MGDASSAKRPSVLEQLENLGARVTGTNRRIDRLEARIQKLETDEHAGTPTQTVVETPTRTSEGGT